MVRALLAALAALTAGMAGFGSMPTPFQITSLLCATLLTVVITVEDGPHFKKTKCSPRPWGGLRPARIATPLLPAGQI